MYNLRLVDSEIKKVFDALAKRGILSRTIVVITADHGEAFGENGTWGHGSSLADIAVHVPLVVYQPRLFPPMHVADFTSHADVLPTLLDAMGASYNDAQFQGESLFRPQRRRYTFFYSPQTDQLGSIDYKGQKMVIDFAHDSCWTLNLITDPGEASPKGCDEQSMQRAALLAFRNYGSNLLFHVAYGRAR